MPPVKKIALPPKPVIKTKKPVVPSGPPPKSPADLQNLKVTEYRITLEDGTYLMAKGEHADLIYRYLSECEKHCAEHQLVNYLGPSLSRFDAEDTFMAQGPASRIGLFR